jgi:hypothetical protein
MNPYGESYFMNGPAAGLSNYIAYSWRPDLTVPACQKIMHYIGAHPYDSILDVGCARGYYVKALRQLCYHAHGYDISEWAIANCDPDVKEFVSNDFPKRAFDWAILKDCAEHIYPKDLFILVNTLNDRVTKGILLIVPLAESRGGRYIREEDERDVTHVNRWTLTDWMTFLEEAAPDFNVNASYNIHGIKPAAALTPRSCGFFTLVRP